MKKIAILFLIVLSFIEAFSFTAYADAGPKPSVKIIVKNPPKDEYYLDLLVDYSGDKLYQNIRKQEDYSQELLAELKSYNVAGWRPALTTGTRVPLHGKLTGELKDNTMVHNFSYVGVPKKFKVIIVTRDNQIIVSENIIERKAFNSTVYFDCNKRTLSETSLVLACLLQFVSTCSLTLIIEGLILILFRFSIKQNWKPFLIINIGTQILLTLIVSMAIYYCGLFVALLAYATLEWAIIIAESELFSKYLSEHSKRRRIMFAIIANITSFLFGFFGFIPMMYSF